MELPKELKGTIHFYFWTMTNDVVVSTFDRDGSAYIYLGSKEASADFDVSYDNAVKQVVDALKKEKTDVQAKAQREIDRIDSRISELLAITYQEK